MDSLISNAKAIHSAVKSSVKSSFISITLKSKWYNRQDNLSLELNVGSVKSPKEDTSFTDEERSNLLHNVEMSLGSYKLDSNSSKVSEDKRTGKNFEILNMRFSPIEL